MANWTQKKLLFTIGGGALAVCLLAAGGVYYAQGLIEEIEAKVAQKKDEVAAAEVKIAKIPALQKSVVVLRENLDEYVRILPDTRELTTFVRSLNQFERQSGMLGMGLQLKARRESKTVERFAPIEYTYEGTATLWQALRFMNLIENYKRFVSITDFSINSGGSGGRGGEMRDGDSVHQVRLTLQTYTYNRRAEGKEAEIPDYASLKESLAEEIWKSRVNIGIEGYEHRGQQSRRDILVDPRDRADADVTGPSQSEQRALLERYIAEITRLREMLQRSRRPEATMFEAYSLDKGVKEGLAKVLGEIDADADRLTSAMYRLRWAKEVAKPVDDLKAELADVTPTPKVQDPYLPMKDLQQLVADMDADCKTGQLEQAKARYEAASGRLNGVPADDPRHTLAVAAKSWHVKATTALDFKALNIKVQGVVVNHAGRSGVLLNGETFEEGEYVSDDLMVKTVEEEQVWFVFRGLTLVRTM